MKIKNLRDCWRVGFVAVLAAALSGCASLTVTQLPKDGNPDTKGVRYYLPKPFLQVTPQADGTVSVDVVYLPDKSHEYAVDTSNALFSSFTFQISRDEKELLTAIEYKASTSIVGQQVAASAGAAAVQAYNINAAQLTAVQTLVNTAQTNLDTAKAAVAAAQAALDSDTKRKANGDTSITDAAISAETSALAQAQAKLPVAEQSLKRAQTTAQAVSTSAAVGTTATTTGPTMGTLFGQPIWNTPTVYNLPEKYGPVLFGIDDDGTNVSLQAVTATMPDAVTVADGSYHDGVVHDAQRAFATVTTAIKPPLLLPANQTVTVAGKTAFFAFAKPINKWASGIVTSDAVPPIPFPAATVAPSKDLQTVGVDVSSLPAGKYVLTVKFNYVPDGGTQPVDGSQQAKFTVTTP